MSDATCLKYLRLSLQVIGVLFTCAVYPLTRIWPSGWAWHTDQSNYLTMIIGIYATLGIFLLIRINAEGSHIVPAYLRFW